MYPSDGICPDCRTRPVNGWCDCCELLRLDAADYAAAEQAVEDAHDEELASCKPDDESTQQAIREAA
jgi:hypothetical protein